MWPKNSPVAARRRVSALRAVAARRRGRWPRPGRRRPGRRWLACSGRRWSPRTPSCAAVLGRTRPDAAAPAGAGPARGRGRWRRPRPGRRAAAGRHRSPRRRRSSWCPGTAPRHVGRSGPAACSASFLPSVGCEVGFAVADEPALGWTQGQARAQGMVEGSGGGTPGVAGGLQRGVPTRRRNGSASSRVPWGRPGSWRRVRSR